LPNDFGKKLEAKTLGGLGSGSWYRFNTKTTVEECHSLDVRRLHREGLLKPDYRFSWSWSRGGRQIASVGGVVLGSSRSERVVLLFGHRSGPSAHWENVQQPVALEWTPCNFGGERPWFICSGVVNGVRCGRRVAVLHAAGKWFMCRHCYDLGYESQREDKTHRALRRAQKIRERLGGSANMTEPFPEKPKGMHWGTYERLWREHHEAELEQLASMREWLDRLQRQLR
jgi:hypothetical protein